jgi:hypothetical protein
LGWKILGHTPQRVALAVVGQGQKVASALIVGQQHVAGDRETLTTAQVDRRSAMSVEMRVADLVGHVVGRQMALRLTVVLAAEILRDRWAKTVRQGLVGLVVAVSGHLDQELDRAGRLVVVHVHRAAMMARHAAEAALMDQHGVEAGHFRKGREQTRLAGRVGRLIGQVMADHAAALIADHHADHQEGQGVDRQRGQAADQVVDQVEAALAASDRVDRDKRL